MNKLILALAVALPFTAQANEQTREEITQKTCASGATIAGKIMKYRQNSVPIVKVLDALKSSEEFKKITVLAYKQPRWATKDLKEAEIEKFETGYYLSCIDFYAKENKQNEEH